MTDKRRENLIIIALIAAVLLIIFGMDWRPEYSTDTIDLAERGFFALARQFFENGRFITALMMAVWGWAGKGIPTLYTCNWAGGILLLGSAAFLLQRELKDVIEDPVERTLTALLPYLNPFIIEYFLFIETASFCFSMLCATIALITYVRFMKGGGIRFVFITLGILFVSAFSYQAVTGIFISLLIPFLCRTAKNIGIYIRNLVIALFLYGVPLLANLLYLKFLAGNTRLEATRDPEREFNIFRSFIKTMKRVPDFLRHNFAILPENLFWHCLQAVAIISILIIAARIFKGIRAGEGSRLTDRECIMPFVNIAVILFVIPAISTAAITMGSGWFMPRVVYPIGSMLGSLLINLRMNLWPDEDKTEIKRLPGGRKTISIAISALIGIYFLITMLCFTRIFVERYQMNAGDRIRSIQIQSCIEKYELESGAHIEKIAVYNDHYSRKPYGTDNEGGMAASSFTTVWSDVAGINFYTGQHYKRADRTPGYEEYFEGKEWDCFSEEQLVFDGDTLHMCRW